MRSLLWKRVLSGFRAASAISGTTTSICAACGRRIASCKQQIEHLRLEQVRLSEDAEQARRLQALLGFKEQFISKTVAAQVIGSSGSEQSRVIYIDKGTRDGIKPDMAVITADGVVGKVLRVSNGPLRRCC